jgi:hypothetical protein
MSTPLEDAAELFGTDALSDRKRLRKAYARLVKKHPPDADPAMFQRIRAALEAAQDALDRPAEPEEALDLDALVDGLSVERFAGDLATLETAGRDNANAALAALFLVQATRPTQVINWLVRMRQTGLEDAVLLVLTNTLLDVRPSLAEDPRLQALEHTAGPRMAAVLRGYRVRALIRAERFDAGFDLWRSVEKTLRALDTSGWTYIADAILFYAAERTPTDLLEDLEAAIEELGFDLEEHVHADLARGLHCTRTLKALVEDPAVPGGTAEAIRGGQRTSPPGVFSSLRQAAAFIRRYGDGDLDAGMQRLAVMHPGAYEMIRDMEEQLIGRRRFHQQWADEGAPPESVGEELSDVLRLQARPLLGTRLWILKASVLAAWLVLYLVLVLTDLSRPVRIGVGVLLVVIGSTLYDRYKPRFDVPRTPLSAWRRLVTDFQTTFGTWRHEFLASETGRQAAPDAYNAWLFDDENADLRNLSTAHGYRSTVMMQVDADPPADESAADAKEQDDD